jgi:tripartite-type tricarboxylate transporter receptor subunit TctC
MPLHRRQILALCTVPLGTFAGLAGFTGPAQAEDFPSRPITLVVPFVPGGNVDVTARSVAPALGQVLRQPVIVTNKGGAGGAIGAQFVAQSEPNGYTLLITVPDTLTIVPQMFKTNYRVDSFQSIGSVSTTTPLLVVKKDSRFPDVAAFLAQAKAAPGTLTVAHAGLGSASHLALMQFANAAKVSLNMVAYQGSGPALIDVLGGQVDAAVDQMTSSLAHLRSGGLRALAAMSRGRDPLLPEVPTLHEAGVDFDVVTTLGIFAPAGLPTATVQVLDAALARALADEQVRSRLSAVGSNAQASSATAFQQLLLRENERAIAMAKAGNLLAK